MQTAFMPSLLQQLQAYAESINKGFNKNAGVAKQQAIGDDNRRHLLESLNSRGGLAGIHDMRNDTALSPSVITSHMNKLEKAGIVKRQSSYPITWKVVV